MKIAFICPDGISILLFCRGILDALKSASEKTQVYVVIGDNECVSEIKGLGVEVVVIPMCRFLNPFRDLQTTWNLYRLFRREKFDAVISFSTKPNIYGSIAAWFANIPLRLFHIVGMGAVFLPSNDIKKRVLQIFLLNLYKLASMLVHKVWFTNSNDLDFFVKKKMLDRNKTVLTRNYLDTGYYFPIENDDPVLNDLRKELGIERDNKVVVMVARMIWSKGIREFAEAAELLTPKYPNIIFILIAPLEIGSADEVPESYIKEMEQRANLHWFGFRKDVILFYGISDIAVLPTYYKEGGFPRALLEPMSMGKPVIATVSKDCRGAIDEGQNGYLIPIKDSVALANSIDDLINSKEKMDAFSRHSRRKAVAEFDEKLIVKHALIELGVLQ